MLWHAVVTFSHTWHIRRSAVKSLLLQHSEHQQIRHICFRRSRTVSSPNKWFTHAGLLVKTPSTHHWTGAWSHARLHKTQRGVLANKMRAFNTVVTCAMTPHCAYFSKNHLNNITFYGKSNLLVLSWMKVYVTKITIITLWNICKKRELGLDIILISDE